MGVFAFEIVFEIDTTSYFEFSKRNEVALLFFFIFVML